MTRESKSRTHAKSARRARSAPTRNGRGFFVPALLWHRAFKSRFGEPSELIADVGLPRLSPKRTRQAPCRSSSVGRAPVSKTGCRRFESCLPRHFASLASTHADIKTLAPTPTLSSTGTRDVHLDRSAPDADGLSRRRLRKASGAVRPRPSLFAGMAVIPE